jgi:hypothetical protein
MAESKLYETITREQAEDILNKVQLAMAHKDPEWFDRVAANPDKVDPKLQKLQIEAFKRVIAVNGLKFSKRAEQAMAFFFESSGAASLARFVKDRLRFESEAGPHQTKGSAEG